MDVQIKQEEEASQAQPVLAVHQTQVSAPPPPTHLPEAVQTATEASVAVASIFVSPEEFAEDLDMRLGRANGNVYQRRPGIDGVHDGQIMVRLKKKRFIVIDYGIVPGTADIQAAACSGHIATPAGAGKQKCVTPECPKIGIPVLLYDSAPDEPASLYMRSGLCFTCQRLLNEKRRTQRKRKSDVVSPPSGSVVTGLAGTGGVDAHNHAAASAGPDEAYGLESGHKKFKLNNEIIELSPDAIVINGPVEGTKHQGNGYGFSEIGTDLQNIVRDAVHSTDRLVAAVANGAAAVSGHTSNNAVALAATAAAVAAAGVTGEAQTVSGVSDEALSAANAAVAAADGVSVPGFMGSNAGAAVHNESHQPMSHEEINSIYEKTFLSLSKGIFLLSQWKISWDTASAAAAAAAHNQLTEAAVSIPSEAAVLDVRADGANSTTTMPVADVGVADADAVASAAAVAAAATATVTVAVGEDKNSSNMIPLLLAAEAKGDDNNTSNAGGQASVAGASAVDLEKGTDANDVAEVASQSGERGGDTGMVCV